MSYRHNKSNGGLFKPEGRVSRAMNGKNANATRHKAEKMMLGQGPIVTLGDLSQARIFRFNEADSIKKILSRHGYKGDVKGEIRGVYTTEGDYDRSHRKHTWFSIYGRRDKDYGGDGFFIRVHYPDGKNGTITDIKQLEEIATNKC